jgi:hypothetical protein
VSHAARECDDPRVRRAFNLALDFEEMNMPADEVIQ